MAASVPQIEILQVDVMHTAPEHLSAVELAQCIPDVLASPADVGRLASIFVRPAPNERRALTTVQLSPECGIDGDRWVRDYSHASKDGQPDPRSQVSLMNSRYLRTIAGDEQAMCLAGDNLIVDFDLSEANLPAGSQLAIGDSVVIEISDLSHTGCGKFQNRYGKDVRAFTNNDRGKSLHLRGRYARIITGGTISIGDSVRKTGVSAAVCRGIV
jgi:MOSC domain-containing protein YiiM